MLYFIRHGQTDFNAGFRWQGQVDIPLNETGRHQAHQIKSLFGNRSVKFDSVYSSPLSRALETAKIICSDKLKPIVDSRLIEIDLGDYDGCLETEIEQKIGAAEYLDWRQQNFTVPAPNGESIGDVMRRVEPFIAGLRESKSERIGVVAHQGVLMAAKALIADVNDPHILTSFKQANDEVDVWSLTSSSRLEVLRVDH